MQISHYSYVRKGLLLEKQLRGTFYRRTMSSPLKRMKSDTEKLALVCFGNVIAQFICSQLVDLCRFHTAKHLARNFGPPCLAALTSQALQFGRLWRSHTSFYLCSCTRLGDARLLAPVYSQKYWEPLSHNYVWLQCYDNIMLLGYAPFTGVVSLCHRGGVPNKNRLGLYQG